MLLNDSSLNLLVVLGLGNDCVGIARAISAGQRDFFCLATFFGGLCEDLMPVSHVIGFHESRQSRRLVLYPVPRFL